MLLAVLEVPTTCPALLIAKAALKFPPAGVPSEVILEPFHKNAAVNSPWGVDARSPWE
jgi:hypothetical protein